MSKNEWTLYSESRPKAAGVYEWRIASKAVSGAVLIVAAHMRRRGAGGEFVLSPVFDYWDGYRVIVPGGIQWRATELHADMRSCDQKVIEVEGLSPCECIYCGRRPTYSAHHRHRDGGIFCSGNPWDLNSWQFLCCAWGNTPHMKDPREIEAIRRKALATAADAAQRAADRANEESRP